MFTVLIKEVRDCTKVLVYPMFMTVECVSWLFFCFQSKGSHKLDFNLLFISKL